MVPRVELGKRKRGEEEEGEDTREQENVCPNSSEKVTPQRRGKCNARTGQTRLFQQKEEQSTSRTPSNPKAKGKQQNKTPMQTGECVQYVQYSYVQLYSRTDMYLHVLLNFNSLSIRTVGSDTLSD